MQSLGGSDDSSTKKVKVVNGMGGKYKHGTVDLIIYMRAKIGWRIYKNLIFPRTREW